MAESFLYIMKSWWTYYYEYWDFRWQNKHYFKVVKKRPPHYCCNLVFEDYKVRMCINKFRYTSTHTIYIVTAQVYEWSPNSNPGSLSFWDIQIHQLKLTYYDNIPNWLATLLTKIHVATQMTLDIIQKAQIYIIEYFQNE